MPWQPDFYCFFYCAAWDRPRGIGTHHHGTGSQPLVEAAPRCSRRRPNRGLGAFGGRSSGSWGVWSEAQRQIPVGRRGVAGLVRCSMSPSGSIRRGR
jgi:hypothetical protein